MTESHRDVMMKTSVTPDLESVCPLGRADLAWLRNMGQARAGRDGPARQERPAVKRSTAQLGLNILGIISALQFLMKILFSFDIHSSEKCAFYDGGQ